MKERNQVTKARGACRKTIFFLLVLFAVGTGFAAYAYQYIISGTPVADPSEAAYSDEVSLDARVADDQANGTALETRVKTSAPGVCAGEVDLARPGMSVILR